MVAFWSLLLASFLHRAFFLRARHPELNFRLLVFFSTNKTLRRPSFVSPKTRCWCCTRQPSVVTLLSAYAMVHVQNYSLLTQLIVQIYTIWLCRSLTTAVFSHRISSLHPCSCAGPGTAEIKSEVDHVIRLRTCVSSTLVDRYVCSRLGCHGLLFASFSRGALFTPSVCVFDVPDAALT